MEIMISRYTELKKTIAGLNDSGIPLVGLNGDTYVAAGYGDSLGAHYFIPWIAKTFGISLDFAINIFFGALLWFPALIAISCFFLAFKNWPARLISTTGILLLTGKFSDVYISFFFSVVSIIPIFVLLHQKFSGFGLRLILSTAFSGIIIGYCNFIRDHSGTGVLLFLFFWIFFNSKITTKNKLLTISILIFFASIPYTHFKYLEYQRDQFLTKNNPNFQHLSRSHYWHSIYIGLGYLKNKYGIEYKDEVSFHKVNSIDPNIGNFTNEYEQILKNECLLLAKTDPKLIIKNVLFKIITVILKIILYSNIGLLFCFYLLPTFRSIIPFLVSAAFYSLPGILVMPLTSYIAGVVCIATIFGIYMICLGIEKLRSVSSLKYT